MKAKYKERKDKLDNINFKLQLEDYVLRDQQKKALDWIKKPIKSGKKFMILEMPTGSGKSIFSQYFIDYYWREVNSNAKFDILTNTKILQKQYTNEFSYMKNLAGRNAYTCYKWNNSCEYGKVCNKNNNTKCEECPYSEAYRNWIEGNISVTNFHIHSIFSLYNKKIIEERNSDVLIVDESHLLEETINNFVSFTLSKKTWKNFVSDKKSLEWEEDISDLNSVSDLIKWIEDKFKLGLKNAINKKYREMVKSNSKKSQSLSKTINNMERLQMTIQKFLLDYKKNKTDWISDKRSEKGEILWEIRPLWTSNIMKESIWSNYKHVILMSGSIINSSTFCELNGIDKSKASSLKMSSSFPLKNRPIYYLPTGKLTWKEKKKSWNNFLPIIKKLLKKYKNKKGIIHTGNYEIWQWIKNEFGKNKRMIFACPKTREIALKEHLNSKENTILVSPSMMQGIDLKDDYSRFQIIVKIPFPSLASKVNKQRLKTNPTWYSWRTVLDMVQSYGRSIRSKKDWADTIILDSSFSDVIRQNSNIIPKYFLDAIKTKK